MSHTCVVKLEEIGRR